MSAARSWWTVLTTTSPATGRSHLRRSMDVKESVRGKVQYARGCFHRAEGAGSEKMRNCYIFTERGNCLRSCFGDGFDEPGRRERPERRLQYKPDGDWMPQAPPMAAHLPTPGIFEDNYADSIGKNKMRRSVYVLADTGKSKSCRFDGLVEEFQRDRPSPTGRMVTPSLCRWRLLTSEYRERDSNRWRGTAPMARHCTPTPHAR